jgi:GTP-binding protein HflX
MVAFRATLEELENADLLLHVIDISSPQHEDQIKAVDKILSELRLHHTPCIRVLNKMDLVQSAAIDQFCGKLNALAISAKSSATLIPLIEKMEDMVEPMVKN